MVVNHEELPYTEALHSEFRMVLFPMHNPEGKAMVLWDLEVDRANGIDTDNSVIIKANAYAPSVDGRPPA